MLSIKSFCFNPFQENTYILFNDAKEAIIVDPGCYSDQEKQTITDFILENKLKIQDSL